jgi:hypothetical protein
LIPLTADCERTLSITAGAGGAAATLKPRCGGVIGEAERNREDEADQ